MVKRLWLSVAVSVVLISVGGLPPVQAQGACSRLVADGLAQPRFLTVGDDGSVYVSEAGSGGTETLPLGPNADPGQQPGTRGLTGRVTKIGADGARTVVADGLPSYSSDEGASGPAGLVFANGALWLAIGGPADATSEVAPLSTEGRLVRIDPRGGAVSPVADLLGYEKANNPDPYTVESNLYGLALGADGNLYAADAGGNALYRVDPRSGQLSLVTVFPGQPISREELPAGLIPPDQPVANPERGDKPEIDPVPTGVAAGPDGNLYVGLLPGFPFPSGRAKVLRVTPSGTVNDAASGLTMVVSVAFGPDNLLYVSQISNRLEFKAEDEPPDIQPGSVVRVLPDGSKQVVADGLSLPNGIAFDRAGNLYVAVQSAPAPGASSAAAQGQVLRCDGVARPAPGPSAGQPAAQPSSQPVQPRPAQAPAQAPAQLPR